MLSRITGFTFRCYIACQAQNTAKPKPKYKLGVDIISENRNESFYMTI